MGYIIPLASRLSCQARCLTYFRVNDRTKEAQWQNHWKFISLMLQKNKRIYIILLIVFLLSSAYISFFSEGIPFVWEDVDQINLCILADYKKILLAYISPLPNFYWEKSLTRDPSLADRPVQVFIGKFFNEIFGYNPYPYHFLKGLAFCILLMLISFFIFRYFNSLCLAGIICLFILLANPIYQSLLWSLEMEVVSQFFMFAVYLMFFKIYYSDIKKEKLIIFQIAIFVLFLTSFKAKPSSSVIPPALTAFILLTDYKKIRKYWLLLSAMFFIALMPKVMSPSFYYHQPFKAHQIIGFLNQVKVVIGLPLILVSMVSFIAVICFRIMKGKSSENSSGLFKESEERKFHVLLLFALWAFFSMCLWPILPSTETRYLAQSLIPLISFVCISVYIAASMINRKAFKQLIFVIFFILASFQVRENIKLSIQYRGFWGSFFIAVDKTYQYIENNYKNSLICYPFGWREIFYPYKGSRNDWIWVSPRNENLAEKFKEKNISLYSNGFIKADSYSHIFWVFPIKLPPGIKYSDIIRGQGITLFDSVVKRLKIDIQGIQILTLNTLRGTKYPVIFYIVKIR